MDFPGSKRRSYSSMILSMVSIEHMQLLLLVLQYRKVLVMMLNTASSLKFSIPSGISPTILTKSASMVALFLVLDTVCWLTPSSIAISLFHSPKFSYAACFLSTLACCAGCIHKLKLVEMDQYRYERSSFGINQVIGKTPMIFGFVQVMLVLYTRDMAFLCLETN